MNSHPIEILVVEDNPADAYLIQRAFRSSVNSIRTSVVEDGLSAIDFLRRQGSHSEAPRPDIVLLDLNIPGKDGHEVLREIKGDPALREIPVVIYTSSSAPKDIQLAYRLGSNCYVRKPIDADGFFHVMSSIESFWLNIVSLPPA